MGGLSKVLDGLAHYFTFGCHVFVVRVPGVADPGRYLDDVGGIVQGIRFYNRYLLAISTYRSLRTLLEPNGFWNRWDEIGIKKLRSRSI